MPDPNYDRPAPADWLGLWTDMAVKMMHAGWGLAPHATPPDAFRQVRAAMLEAWGDYWQSFLRTPEFLQTMKQALDANIYMRRQAAESLGQWQQETQGTSRQDVDQIMRALRHLEHRISDSGERLARRLDDLEDRLGALENGGLPEHAARRGDGRCRGARNPEVEP